MSLPAEVERLRKNKLRNIIALRSSHSLTYENASIFLNVFMQKIVTGFKQQVVGGPGFSVAGGLSFMQQNEVHDKLFDFISSNKLNIPLAQLLGLADITNKTNEEIVTKIFGDNTRETRLAYFREALGADFDVLSSHAANLRVTFGSFSNDLKAIFLKQMRPVGTEEDLIQYHMTVARTRIHDELLSSYHFSNYFYPEAAPGGGGGGLPKVTRRQTYFSNSGDQMSYNNSLSAAIRERKGSAATEKEMELHRKIAAWYRHLAAPTANTRAEIGPAKLAEVAGTNNLLGAAPNLTVTRRRRHTELSPENEVRLLNEATRLANAERAALAAAEAAGGAEAAGAAEQAPVTMSTSAQNKLSSYFNKHRNNMRKLQAGTFGQRLAETVIEQVLIDPESVFTTQLSMPDMQFIFEILQSPLIDRREAEKIVIAIMRDRYGIKDHGIVPSVQTLTNAESAYQKLASKESLSEIKGLMKEKGVPERTAEEMTEPLIAISRELYNAVTIIITKMFKSLANDKAEKPSIADFENMYRILFSLNLPPNNPAHSYIEQWFHKGNPLHGISEVTKKRVLGEIEAQRRAQQSAQNKGKVSNAERNAAIAALLEEEEAEAATKASKGKTKKGKRKGGFRKTRRGVDV